MWRRYAAHVEGQFVFNAALLADLAQDVVAMAVARHIKDMVVEPLIRVFLDDAFGNIQQADTLSVLVFLRRVMIHRLPSNIV